MNKFHAITTIFDGIKFPSKAEANYYKQLLLLKKAKNETDRVLNIELQPEFKVVINEKKIGTYTADFRVKYANRTEIIDVKGLKKGSAYALFRFKKKVVEALYNIEIIEK